MRLFKSKFEKAENVVLQGPTEGGEIENSSENMRTQSTQTENVSIIKDFELFLLLKKNFLKS